MRNFTLYGWYFKSRINFIQYNYLILLFWWVLHETIGVHFKGTLLPHYLYIDTDIRVQNVFFSKYQQVNVNTDVVAR